MAEKTLLDISSENFDSFLINNAKNAHANAKEELPIDFSFKLYKAGGKLNQKFAAKLNVLQKLYVLWKALGKRVYIVIEDENQGITPGGFMEVLKANKKRDYGSERVKEFVGDANFVLADKQLSDAISYLNNLCHSPAYRYLSRVKNQPVNQTTQYREQMSYVAKFLAFYESNKKKWVLETGVTIPEFFVLLYTYHGREVLGSEMYRSFYKRSYQSSPAKIKTAFGSLQHKGYLRKTGIGRGALLSITALGVDLMNGILTKYAIKLLEMEFGTQ